MKKFVIDVTHCNGCRNCQLACKDEHCGNEWAGYSASQPDTGQFWMNVKETLRGQVPVVKMTYTPVLCAHCADAPCQEACIHGAIGRREDGIILISPDKCQGCKECVKACPIGAVYFNQELSIAQKCTGCAHLLDNGWEVPRCVDACPHDAIKWVDEDEAVFDEECSLPEVADYGPRVFYHGIPKNFIAGCVVDFDADEVVIGLEVQLLGEGICLKTSTDEFGDFEFEGLDSGLYSVCYAGKSGDVKTEVDLTNGSRTLGDLSFE